MSNLNDIKTTQASKTNGSNKRQPLDAQGALLAHSLRQLARAGYPFEIDETPDGVVIRIDGIHKATAANGNLVFDGVSE